MTDAKLLHMPLTTVNRTPPSLSAATALRLAQARYLSGSGGFRQMTPRFPPGKIFEGLDPGRYDTSPRAIRPHSPRATCNPDDGPGDAWKRSNFARRDIAFDKPHLYKPRPRSALNPKEPDRPVRKRFYNVPDRTTGVMRHWTLFPPDHKLEVGALLGPGSYDVISQFEKPRPALSKRLNMPVTRASGLGWQPVAIASQPLTPRPSTSSSVSPRHASFYAVSSQYEQNKA